MAVYLNDEVVASQLSIAEAVRCVDAAFRSLARGEATNAVRVRMAADSSVMNIMWACAPAIGMMGVKSYVTAGRGVTRGAALALMLYSMGTGEMVALLEANRLGQIRTGAATVIATRAMANENPVVLSVYGTGFQAEYQVRALLDSVTTIADVRVVGRDPQRRDAFIQRLADTHGGVRFSPADSKSAASSADVIVTATNSATPLFEAEWLRPGTHINAIGSNDPKKREIGKEVLERAGLVLVDDLEVAAKECGDLLVNQWDVSRIGALGDLLLGRMPGRLRSDEITIFESQGLAVQDLVCGAAVVEQARKRGLGIRLSH
ncbi:MAG: ornithine cyclodeaminase family protein [Castellaniella sp.]|uniref:ornithine cyclodeaminase family protein n=1 Tax=Castellaniella sp. TaxID=1955812 RepID=UPI001210501B|nr:ornithine cyclodeaminase family protein [Castellaniella sp.]TAN30960.1 MAG: ornithine cyclodeaminase family protein [Castellaniella sp.]